MNSLIVWSFKYFPGWDKRYERGGVLFAPSISAGIAALIALLVSLSPALQAADQKFVNIYSYRQEVLIRPLLDRFTELSGIEVRLVSSKRDIHQEHLNELYDVSWNPG